VASSEARPSTTNLVRSSIVPKCCNPRFANILPEEQSQQGLFVLLMLLLLLPLCSSLLPD
jgi:hypothetical protein